MISIETDCDDYFDSNDDDFENDASLAFMIIMITIMIMLTKR